MRGKWLLASGIVILAAVAIGALSLLRRDAAPSKPASLPSAPQEPVVFTGSEVSLRGRIQAQQVVAVPAPVEGTVEVFLADVGDEVYEGQLLAQITSAGLAADREAAASELERARSHVDSLESRLISARLEAARARADASRARAEFEIVEKAFLRQQMLFREGATPRLNYEKSEKEFKLARAEFFGLDEVARHAEDRVAEQAKEADTSRRDLAEKTEMFEEAGDRLAAGQLYSPADGLIVSRRGAAGEVVSREVVDLFVIAVNLTLLTVVVEPEPPVLARIAPDQDALIQIAEVPGRGIPGKVREVRNGQVIVEFVNPSPVIKPGLTAQVVIKLT